MKYQKKRSKKKYQNLLTNIPLCPIMEVSRETNESLDTTGGCSNEKDLWILPNQSEKAKY